MPGKYYEEFDVGMTFKHHLSRTVTETDNVLFSALTMNTQPLHISEDYAAKTQFGQRIVNGIYTMGLVVGITVPDLTDGTIIANLGYDEAWTKKVLDNFQVRGNTSLWEDGKFIHPHDACWDKDGNIFVVEWVPTGRVSFLKHVG